VLVVATLGGAWWLAQRRRPNTVAPTGWADDGSTLASFTASRPGVGVSVSVRLRRLRWGERSEVAALIARAHRYSAAYVSMFQDAVAPSTSDIGYAYTVAAREALRRQLPGSRSAMRPADCPSLAQRVKGLSWVLERNLTMLHSNQELWVGEDQRGRLVCFAMLIDPERDTYSLRDKIRVGLLTAPLAIGWAAVWRLLRVSAMFERGEEHALREHQPPPRGTALLRLERVAVEPELQGAGIGSALVDALCDRLDAQGSACYLTTQNELTARMYTRCGWGVLKEEQLDGSTSFPFPNWHMWRPSAVRK
jgi:GNAT superfamily N-acetyltransferase